MVKKLVVEIKQEFVLHMKELKIKKVITNGGKL